MPSTVLLKAGNRSMLAMKYFAAADSSEMHLFRDSVDLQLVLNFFIYLEEGH